MSDRTFTTVVSPLVQAWRPAKVAPAVARPVIAAQRRAPWFGVPDMGDAASPGKPSRAGLWAELRAVWRRQRSRRCLVELDARTLKDIGVSYAEAEAEANKPFWVR